MPETRKGNTSALSGEWWRSAVIYQIYPRSFADSDGDGIGDLPGITAHLDDLVDLGVDAIWLSPFYTSPQRDAGYDVADYVDVDPIFGSLDDFDSLVAGAHARNLRLIIDIVPNHTSSDHQWFLDALMSAPGSLARARYLFRDGRGAQGELPPNNWESVFGGTAWTRIAESDGSAGQWYLHLFDSTQPDLNWQNPWVREQFRGILRFWLDRGVDGFRVDVAHGMIKADGLPDFVVDPNAGSMGGGAARLAPFWAQAGLHEINREWRRVLDEYPGERALVAEAWVEPLSRLADWVRSDEMHQAFNFRYLETPWHADALRTTIEQSIDAFAFVGAPSTWVLSNHDVVRHASRLALASSIPQGEGIGLRSKELPDPVLGLRRARAATLLMLGLPGSAYLYQGEELGLPEVIDLPDDARQDPTWFRTNHARYGRDGCRVPLPWQAGRPALGFSPTGASWLPQPGDWSTLARASQRGVAGSTLELYRSALRLRAQHQLGRGALQWLDTAPGVIGLANGAVRVFANIGSQAVPLPTGSMILSSATFSDELPADSTVWLVD